MNKTKTRANFTKYGTVFKQWGFTLYFCGIGGLLFNLSGLFLVCLAFLGFIENAEQTDQLADLLIILSFFMLMFYSHALDKISENKLYKSSVKS